jgi:hypothetical protein
VSLATSQKIVQNTLREYFSNQLGKEAKQERGMIWWLKDEGITSDQAAAILMAANISG